MIKILGFYTIEREGYGVGNQTDSKYDFCDVLVLE